MRSSNSSQILSLLSVESSEFDILLESCSDIELGLSLLEQWMSYQYESRLEVLRAFIYAPRAAPAQVAFYAMIAGLVGCTLGGKICEK